MSVAFLEHDVVRTRVVLDGHAPAEDHVSVPAGTIATVISTNPDGGFYLEQADERGRTTAFFHARPDQLDALA